MKGALPAGDPDPGRGATDMGALWRDDADERLVRFNNYEDYEDYEVEVYWLDPEKWQHDDSDVVSERQYWDDDTLEAFVNSPETAWLSGHNLPGVGRYGAFVDGPRPNCPECGAFMSPGTPDYHGPDTGLPALGFTCKKYRRTNGGHEGYMTQREAIGRGYYLTIESLLNQMAHATDAAGARARS